MVGIVIAVPAAAQRVVLGGIPPFIRILRQLRKQGFNGVAIVVFSDSNTAKDFRHRAEARFVGPEGAAPPAEEWIRLPGDIVLPHGSIGSLRPTRNWPETRSWIDRTCRGAPASVDVPILGRVTDEASARALESAIIRRPTDPHFTRLWRRSLSRRLSRRLVAAGVTPNNVTALATLVGLASASLFALGSYAWSLVASMMLILSRILDDCDGEVARIAVQDSDLGAKLDTAGDISVGMGTFVGIVIGLGGESWVLPLALVVSGAVVTTVLLLTRVIGTGLSERDRWARFFESGASGDFAYLLFPFMLIGRPDWFLWASAVGSHAYWMGLGILLVSIRAPQPSTMVSGR